MRARSSMQKHGSSGFVFHHRNVFSDRAWRSRITRYARGPDGLAPAYQLIQDEARNRSYSSRRYSSTKTSPTFSPPRRPSASITRLDYRSKWALSRGRVERMSFMASRSLLPSGHGNPTDFCPTRTIDPGRLDRQVMSLVMFSSE
jgi:hypothetical protein